MPQHCGQQAIDATLASLAEDDSRFLPLADKYWNARGGSYNDGGAFLLSVKPDGESADGTRRYSMEVNNKFGGKVGTNPDQKHCDLSVPAKEGSATEADTDIIAGAAKEKDAQRLFDYMQANVAEMDYDRLRCFVSEVVKRTASEAPKVGIEALTLAFDRRYPTGTKKRSSVQTIVRQSLGEIFEKQPRLTQTTIESKYRRITLETRETLRAPQPGETSLLIDAKGFDPEGPGCDAYLAVDAFHLGWRHLIHYNSRGTRFHAAGFGPDTDGLVVDCYDNAGDYLASGMDGLTANMHGNAQDQLCQVAKRGKLVIYGDVGQTFLYGAKGGEVYVLGNAAGRPMINAVGKPRVVINGTALDFLAESFMAGDPLNGGGFAIVNGLQIQDDGTAIPLDLLYPGSNHSVA